jgi:hypothetical protein
MYFHIFSTPISNLKPAAVTSRDQRERKRAREREREHESENENMGELA